MFTLIEISESSSETFADAVRKGVNKIISSGKKVYFFKVLEMKELSIQGNKQYCVRVQLAVDSNSSRLFDASGNN
jgi:flavin-binding protein dodecin